ncbi:hypothetical protein HPP92_006419 [Vanilla planifolia]|uniref:Uncharacterized protein n=1 Tax=Vanilla planifolia TaxID=51239 RepID=A0A835RQL8_VANPL|nr:hypothetical protein HPP92_006419 [Vanilla planifolia]
MADIEKKQQLLVQEQKMWHQYAVDGMQGQASLTKLSNAYYYLSPALQYGIPPTTAYYYPNIPNYCLPVVVALNHCRWPMVKSSFITGYWSTRVDEDFEI